MRSSWKISKVKFEKMQFSENCGKKRKPVPIYVLTIKPNPHIWQQWNPVLRLFVDKTISIVFTKALMMYHHSFIHVHAVYTYTRSHRLTRVSVRCRKRSEDQLILYTRTLSTVFYEELLELTNLLSAMLSLYIYLLVVGIHNRVRWKFARHIGGKKYWTFHSLVQRINFNGQILKQ